MAAVISALTTVFTAIFTWIISAVESVIPLFYVATGEAAGLTFLGVLAVIGLGISLFFLLMRVIENFLHLRG